MHHRVLIPEGRSEYEWFRLLADVLETGDQATDAGDADMPSFGTVVGVVPTHDSAVAETFKALCHLRGGLVPLVDGDDVGNSKVQELRGTEHGPALVLQWRDGWTIEDAIGWVLKGDEADVLGDLKSRIDREFASIDELVALFKVKTGPGRLKTDYLAFEAVTAIIGSHAGCRARAVALLEAVTRACLGHPDGCALLQRDPVNTNEHCVVLRLLP